MTPPRISTWVLTHFSCTQDTESLLGDLAEELSRGRSRNWYRKQVVVAIVAGAWTTITSHKLLTIRALFVGLATVITYMTVQLYVMRLVLAPYLAREHVSLWLFPLTEQVLSSGRWPISGWIVARFHRPYGRAMLLGYAASLWVFVPCDALLVSLNLWFHLHRRAPLDVVSFLSFMVADTPLILLGGLWVRQQPKTIEARQS